MCGFALARSAELASISKLFLLCENVSSWHRPLTVTQNHLSESALDVQNHSFYASAPETAAGSTSSKHYIFFNVSKSANMYKDLVDLSKSTFCLCDSHCGIAHLESHEPHLLPHLCWMVGADAALPSSLTRPILIMCFRMTSLGTCLVSRSAG